MKFSIKIFSNSTKGITLMSLIITIIVMLILASVTITVALNGGLFEYAKLAVDKNQETQELEKIQLAITSAYIAGAGTITADNLNNELRDSFKDNSISVNEFANGWIYKEYIINKAGNVSKSRFTLDGLRCYLNAKDLKIDSTNWKDRTTSKEFEFKGVTINSDVSENGLFLNAEQSEQKCYFLSPVVDDYSPLTLEFYGKLLEPINNCYRLIITTRNNIANQANICYGNSSRPQNQRGIYTDLVGDNKIYTSQYLNFPCNAHIVITYNNNIVKIYYNGELIKTGSISSMPIHNAVVLGGWYDINAEKTNAYYKIVRIYNKELNQDEIINNYLYNRTEWND